MKNIEVINAFVSGRVPSRGLKANSVTAEGGRLFSYNTVIAEIVGDTIHINNTRYSVTTSKAQNYLRAGAARYFNKIVEHEAQAMGAKYLA